MTETKERKFDYRGQSCEWTPDGWTLYLTVHDQFGNIKELEWGFRADTTEEEIKRWIDGCRWSKGE